MQIPEEITAPSPQPDQPQRASAASIPVAPAWHTIALIAAILAYSALSASRFSSAHAAPHRLSTYAFTIAIELILLGWVIFGLRLGKISFRDLLGENALTFKSIALDMVTAFLFWFGSMMVLAAMGVLWFVAEAIITHRSIFEIIALESSAQQSRVRALSQIAPSGAIQIAAWVLLCIVAGFAEEAVFRGYLQRQFIAWGRGSAVGGILLSAIIFGCAHAYEGARSMFLIAIFGAMLGGLAFFRRGLRPGIVAHSWHDLVVGLALTFVQSHHLKMS